MESEAKTVLVTGGAQGIGAAIVKKFAYEKYNVVVADFNIEVATLLVEELSKQGITHAMAVEMDVSKEESVQRGFDLVVENFKTIDVVVVNAGVQYICGLDELEFSDWRRVLSVNLDGAFLTARAAMRVMKKNKSGGAIVFIGSSHSKTASMLKGPYVASKHAILGLSRVIAKEGAEYGIKSNTICPGFVRTALVEKQIPEQAKTLGMSEEDVIKKVLLKDTFDGEFSTTQDVSDAVYFVASFPTLAISGQSLVVSHGWVME